MEGLRTLILRGGLYTAGRQVLGMALSFGGLAILVRLIGPASYGVYVSAFAICNYAFIMLALGIDVFLVRSPEDPGIGAFHQATTLGLATGTAGFLLAIPGSALAATWIGDKAIAPTMLGLFAGLPLQISALVPAALLQRRLEYRQLAQCEFAALVAYYAVSLPLAAKGAGVAAPVAGFWAQQGLLLVLLYRASGYRPALTWRWQHVRAILAYGVPLTGATWMWHARFLVNPLIVARLLGTEAAATVGLGIRLAEALSFMRTVSWRVSIPAMARVQNDRRRLAAAIGEGMRLQLLVTGPAMICFSALAPWGVPFAFGHAWLPMVPLFPFIALAYLVNSVFSLHLSALHVIGRNGDVAVVHLIHAAILFAAASTFIPAHGLLGYGMAEAAALASYGLLHAVVRLRIGPVPAGLGLAWALGSATPLFTGILGAWGWLGPVVALSLPATWRNLAWALAQLGLMAGRGSAARSASDE